MGRRAGARRTFGQRLEELPTGRDGVPKVALRLCGYIETHGERASETEARGDCALSSLLWSAESYGRKFETWSSEVWPRRVMRATRK